MGAWGDPGAEGAAGPGVGGGQVGAGGLRGWHWWGRGPGDHPDPRMLPHADQALVDEAKICDYLLSDTHPVGRFKARVFRSLGYTVESWRRLRDDLLHHGQTGTVQRIGTSAYGIKVVISATLKGPNGASRPFRTVWLIHDQSTQPRLVTAFPE